MAVRVISLTRSISSRNGGQGHIPRLVAPPLRNCGQGHILDSFHLLSEWQSGSYSATRPTSSRNGGLGHILDSFHLLAEWRSGSYPCLVSSPLGTAFVQRNFWWRRTSSKKKKKKKDLALVSGISNASQPLDWWRPALFFSRRGYVSWNS
jgi:hypothetical protein